MSIDSFLKNSKVGIVIIDMQKDFAMELPNIRSLIKRQRKILSTYNNVPVVCLEFSPKIYGHFLPEIISAIKSNMYLGKITKYFSNGFFKTTLEDTIKRQGIENLFFMGCNTSHCVWETAESALGYGFNIATSMNVISEPAYFLRDYPNRLEQCKEWYRRNCFVFEED